MSFDAFSQLRVKEGSFKHDPLAIMDDKYDHYDGNDEPMALIKISTVNINEAERMRINFRSNRATQIVKKYLNGQVWLYLSKAADFLEISHPDYSQITYQIPETLCDFCIYEMVLEYIPFGYQTNQKSQNNFLVINVEQHDAAIFVNNNYVGNGSVEVPLQIGLEHTYKIECDLYHSEIGNIIMTAGDPIEKNIDLRPAHGFINVNTEPEEGAIVYIDGKKVGTSPYKSDKLASGTYKVKVLMTMFKPVEQTVTVTDGNTTQTTLNMSDNFSIFTGQNGDKIYVDDDYVEINFITLNAAYSVAPQTSFGLTYGHVKKVGWFVSAMTNFGFMFGADEWDELYYTEEAVFSGDSSKTRLSLTGGLLLRLGGTTYMKLGAGYGARVKCWELNDGLWYEYAPDTYRGIDLTAGLMFNANRCVLSADVVTTNLKTLEFKIGIGINWN